MTVVAPSAAARPGSDRYRDRSGAGAQGDLQHAGRIRSPRPRSAPSIRALDPLGALPWKARCTCLDGTPAASRCRGGPALSRWRRSGPGSGRHRRPAAARPRSRSLRRGRRKPESGWLGCPDGRSRADENGTRSPDPGPVCTSAEGPRSAPDLASSGFQQGFFSNRPLRATSCQEGGVIVAGADRGRVVGRSFVDHVDPEHDHHHVDPEHDHHRPWASVI